jgi:23S rRNA (pseudouridine1915-N3)-methyltransferase
VKIVIAAVGRAREAHVRALFHEYARRLAQGGRRAWPIVLHEIEEKRRLAPLELKAREADLLRAHVPDRARLVALDASGKMLSSDDLARRLGAWRDAGAPAVAFVIGGAEGLDPALIARADLVLSLGAMTWPHQLVRVMLAEQLYRARAILDGHPYHRG